MSPKPYVGNIVIIPFQVHVNLSVVQAKMA